MIKNAKFCTNCRAKIDAKAEIYHRCGVIQLPMRSAMKILD